MRVILDPSVGLSMAHPILLDTHIWFYFLQDSLELRADLKDQIEKEPNDVLISPISVWELMVLARKKRVKLRPSPERFIRDALSSYPFKPAWLTDEIAILSETLEFKHIDPADRFLAATAMAHGATMATDDTNLRNLGWLPCC